MVAILKNENKGKSVWNLCFNEAKTSFFQLQNLKSSKKEISVY